MEETIKIQEEFENLIEQLERLKNINELSSSNAESAKKVIEHIDSFIKSTNDYKHKIEKDYSLKSDKIEKLLSAFDKSIILIDTKTKELTSSVSKSFNEFKVETSKELNENNNEIKDAFILFNKSFATLKEDIKSTLEQSNYSIIEQLNNNKNEILENTGLIKTFAEKSNTQLSKQLTDNQELSIQRLDQQGRDIKTLKIILFVICGLIVIGIIATILK